MYITIWILIAAAIVVFYFIEKRFKRIEIYINNIPANSNKNINDLKPISYQVEISIKPEWVKVIRWCFPELKTDHEAVVFMESLWKDPKLEIDRETSLLSARPFGFVEFYDGVSGLNPIWSTYHNGFIKDLEVWGRVLDCGFMPEYFRDKFPDSPIHQLMVISPSFLGFDSPFPSYEVEDKNKISQFPYDSVINFFVDVQKNIGRDLMVKKFPEKLQQIFDKYQIKYDPLDYENYGVNPNYCTQKEMVKSKWLEEKGIELYDQKMRSHTFRNPYFLINISLKFFSPDDR